MASINDMDYAKVGAIEMGEAGKQENLGRRHAGSVLEWSGVNYTVPATVDAAKPTTDADKTLLMNMSGVVRPGTLTGIMGSSGAGKSTLLDVLAGRLDAPLIQYPMHAQSSNEKTYLTAESKCVYWKSIFERRCSDKLAHVESKNEESSSRPDFSWPSLTDVANEVMNADYNETLTNECDVIGQSGSGKLCCNGFVGTVRIAWRKDLLTPYTGLFQDGEVGVIRLSSALRVSKPAESPSSGWGSTWLKFGSSMLFGQLAEANLFPCVALKIFRHGDYPSGNMLFGGRKTGQSSDFFFEHAVATHLTEKMPMIIKWVYNLFTRYSKYPLQLGLSELASMDVSGERVEAEKMCFPWMITLVPSPDNCLQSVSFEDMHVKVKEGMVLHDIFALPSPASALATDGDSNCCLQRLGSIILTSPLYPDTASNTNNSGDRLFFKHQRKEEDYALRPEWEEILTAQHGQVGAIFVEEMVRDGRFV